MKKFGRLNGLKAERGKRAKYDMVKQGRRNKTR